MQKHWNIKWGSFYKGLKEVPASNINDCVENCQNNEKCFVLSWAESKCYIQDDGTGELKPENLEARLGVLTLLGRVKRLLRFRKFGKLGELPFLSNSFDFQLEIFFKTFIRRRFPLRHGKLPWRRRKQIGR